MKGDTQRVVSRYRYVVAYIPAVGNFRVPISNRIGCMKRSAVKDNQNNAKSITHLSPYIYGMVFDD